MEQQVRALITARKSTKVDGAEGGRGLSLDSQGEAARAFCERMGWLVVAATEDIVSGSVDPRSRKDLGRWLNDPERLAQFDVIVSYAVDRLSRGSDVDFSRIEAWAADHGKTLVVVDSMTGIRYPARDDSDRWQWMAAKTQAGKELESAKERNVRSRRSIRANGGLNGRAPWGMEIVGSRYTKTLVPTPEGRKYIPEIFRRIIDGQSVMQLARWLDEEGVRPVHGSRWSDGSLRQIIQNQTYAGRRVDAKGAVELELPEDACLIDMDVWKRANQKIATRRTTKVVAPKPEMALLVGATCSHPACDAGYDGKPSPLYRLQVGRGAARTAVYRCSGAQPTRKGCGAPLIPAAELERMVDMRMFLNADEDYTVVTVSAGEDHASEIATVEADLAGLDLDADDYDVRHAALVAERRRLRALPVEPPVVTKVPVINSDTGEPYSVGDRYLGLDRAGKRKMLSEGYWVAAYRDKATGQIKLELEKR